MPYGYFHCLSKSNSVSGNVAICTLNTGVAISCFTEWPCALSGFNNNKHKIPNDTTFIWGMWGILKERFYSPNVRTIPELNERTTAEFAALNNDKDLCRRICHSIQRRIKLCIDSERQHFEDKM